MTLDERHEDTAPERSAVLLGPLAETLIVKVEANLALQPDATHSLLV